MKRNLDQESSSNKIEMWTRRRIAKPTRSCGSLMGYGTRHGGVRETLASSTQRHREKRNFRSPKTLFARIQSRPHARTHASCSDQSVLASDFDNSDCPADRSEKFKFSLFLSQLSALILRVRDDRNLDDDDDLGRNCNPTAT